ncbi:MAG: ATP-binding cassette domain-containing protein [Oscillospiraceae bacterium]|nr:ATP-binding cassette domain-containing protein [Oscillospiraceae bacterium]
MSANDVIIHIEGLGKTYDEGKETEVKALEDVNLDIYRGEIFGIIGLSGAGKSTLVRCINLLERPTAGRVFISGQEITGMDEADLRLARRKIGMIFQDFNLLEQVNALDNVCFPLRISGYTKLDAEKRAAELLDRVGLSGRAGAFPSQLSGGQKQRVAIARALASDPEVLLCDEAVSALDPTTTIQILELLQEINRELGVTIVMITHEMKVIEKICSRVAIIADSHIVESGNVSDVFRNPRTDAAKKLILPSGGVEPFDGNGRLLRLVFDGTTTDKPIVANMVLSCGEPVSIVAADTKQIDGKTFGQLIIQLPSGTGSAERMMAYLDSENITYTEETDV